MGRTCHATYIMLKKSPRSHVPCYIDTLTHHFYVVKLGVLQSIPFFLMLALKHRLWVLVRNRVPYNLYWDKI